MDIIKSPSAGIALAGVDLILICGATVVFTKKISNINERLDKLEEGKTLKNEGDVFDAINDIYERVEFLEKENEILRDKAQRLEHITNKLLFALNSNNIPVSIEQNVRRRIVQKKPGSSSRTIRPTNKKPQQEEFISYSKAESVSSHDEDDDVLAALQDAKK